MAHALGSLRRIALAGRPDRGGSAAAAASGAWERLPASPYSVLGQGYNVLLATPLSSGLTALDPGFT